MGIGPAVVEDTVDRLADVGLVEVEIELIEDEVLLGRDIELIDEGEADADPVADIELVEKEVDTLDIDAVYNEVLLGLTGKMLLVELSSTVVVVAPGAMVVKVFVSTPLPTTPSLRVL